MTFLKCRWSKRFNQRILPMRTHHPHPQQDCRLVDTLFPCPERVNTMTSYRMKQDMSPDIIYYKKHSIFYLDSQGSSKHFANNSLILPILYLSTTAFLKPQHSSSGKGQSWSQNCPIPLTNSSTAGLAELGVTRK